MNFQDIVAHILGFCLMVADLPTLFKTQTTTPISQHLSNLEISNGYDSTTTTSHIRPTNSPTYQCAPTRDIVIDPSMNNCNGPSNRGDWCYGLDINSDYEDPKNFPVTPDIRKYTLEITNAEHYCGDGYVAPSMLINGAYPGPLIEGNWGDWFEITIINKLTNCNGTAIHWHGLRQWNTVFEDGVGGVTQCPIPPILPLSLQDSAPPGYSNQMTYKWRATQYGASWYHSHFSLQYPDGIAGPLVIHGPTSANYDQDLGPLLITDWYHEDAFSLFWIEEGKNVTGTLVPPSKLINGRGNYTNSTADGTEAQPACTSSGPDGDPRCVPELASKYIIQNIIKGNKYRLRIINTSANSHYTFWIDGHSFTVIATDFVPIEPWTTNVLNVAIGQRYDIVFEANADLSKGDQFWIKMRHCNSICIEKDQPPCPPNKRCTYEECRQGIISYSPNEGDPEKNAGPDLGDQQCSDINRTEIFPVVPRTVTGIPSPFTLQKFKVSLDDDTSSNPPVVSHWSLSDKGYTFVINWTDPALILLESATANPDTWPNAYVPIQVDNWGQSDAWHAFVIEANWTENQLHRGFLPGDPEFELSAVTGAAHPIHLHGHDFVVLLQSTEEFDPHKQYNLTLNNPIRRDVAMLPANGFLMLAFRLDNPGSWLMHCHIAWHASNGLALQFVENQKDIAGIMADNANYTNIVQDLQTQCDNWNWWYTQSGCTFEGEPALQEDSGI